MFLTGLEHCVSLASANERWPLLRLHASLRAKFWHTNADQRSSNVATGKVQNNFKNPCLCIWKSFFNNLNNLFNTKTSCRRCFLRDRVKVVNLSYGSSCLPGKENGYCEDFCCVASQCKAKCTALRHRWEPECSKESSISFISGKSRKKAFSWTLIRPQGVQPGWFLHGVWNACPEKKPKRQSF